MDEVRGLSGKVQGAASLVSQGWGTVPTGYTIGSLHQLPSNTVSLQFELCNRSMTETAIYRAMFALSISAANWVDPASARAGIDGVIWYQVTLDGSHDIVVKPSSSSERPAMVLSDLISVQTAGFGRTDGGEGLCLFYRQMTLSGPNTVSTFDGTVGNWGRFRNGQHPWQFSQTLGGGWLAKANFAEPWLSAVPLGSAVCFPASVPGAVLPVVATKIVTIMSVGDSILSGVSSRGGIDHGIDGVGLKLCKALTRLSLPSTHVNGATSGKSTRGFLALATRRLQEIIPDIILLQTFSANDGVVFSDLAVDEAYRRCIQFANDAEKAGSLVILIGEPPYAGEGSVRKGGSCEAARLRANSSARASGFMFIDCDLIVGSGNDPVNYRAGLSDQAFEHLSERGAQLVSDEIVDALLSRGLPITKSMDRVSDLASSIVGYRVCLTTNQLRSQAPFDPPDAHVVKQSTRYLTPSYSDSSCYDIVLQ